MELWNGFEMREGEFEGRRSIVVQADPSNRTDCWIMKMEYWDAFPEVEIAMLKQGWNVAYVENKHRWCDPEDLELKKRFAEFIHRIFGYREKFVAEGLSCGGLFAVQFAARYPEYVQAMYLDAPVLNLLSCPGDLGRGSSGAWEEYTQATGMTMAQLICSREMPIDHLPVLAGFEIPVVLVYGKEDEVVPFEENGALLKAFYEYRDLPFLAIGKDGCGHHPHGLEDPQPIVEFLLQHA